MSPHSSCSKSPVDQTSEQDFGQGRTYTRLLLLRGGVLLVGESLFHFVQFPEHKDAP